MYIASFDIGKANFAFCVEEIDTESLKKIKSIPKTRRYNADGTPTEAFQDILTKVYETGHTVLLKNIDLTPGTKKEMYLDPQLYINMYRVLDEYKEEYFDKCDIIIVEQQMSFAMSRGKGALAQNTMALKLGQHCQSYFYFCYDGKKEVVEIKAYHKTQVLGCPKIGGKAMPKAQRKKWEGETGLEVLMLRGDDDALGVAEGMKKLDDIGDVILQLQAFKFLRFVVGDM